MTTETIDTIEWAKVTLTDTNNHLWGRVDVEEWGGVTMLSVRIPDTDEVKVVPMRRVDLVEIPDNPEEIY